MPDPLSFDDMRTALAAVGAYRDGNPILADTLLTSMGDRALAATFHLAVSLAVSIDAINDEREGTTDE